MKSNDKSKEYNPFAVNILRLQRYNYKIFTLEKVVFFEFIVVKAIAFKYKPFFHSNKTISEETGIKKAKLATIIKDFIKKGIISVEVKGFPTVQWFTVNFDIIYEKLPKFYQLSENGKALSENGQLLSYFGQLLSEFSQQKELNKKPIKETKNKLIDRKGNRLAPSFSFSLKESSEFLNILERKFNERREEKKPKKFPAAKFPFKKEVLPFAKEALDEMGDEVIYAAWQVFTDKIIAGELEPRQVLKYFFNKKDDSFDVIGSMADERNTKYVYSK